MIFITIYYFATNEDSNIDFSSNSDPNWFNLNLHYLLSFNYKKYGNDEEDYCTEIRLSDGRIFYATKSFYDLLEDVIKDLTTSSIEY